MEVLEIVLIVLIILGALLATIVSGPMRKHLIAETEIKKIGLFQMPFYLKDYYKLVNDTTDVSKKKKFRTHYTLFMIANLAFILCAILLLLIPGSSL